MFETNPKSKLHEFEASFRQPPGDRYPVTRFKDIMEEEFQKERGSYLEPGISLFPYKDISYQHVWIDLARDIPSARLLNRTAEEIDEDTAKAMLTSLLDGLSSKLDLLSEQLDEHERKMKQLRGG